MSFSQSRVPITEGINKRSETDSGKSIALRKSQNIWLDRQGYLAVRSGQDHWNTDDVTINAGVYFYYDADDQRFVITQSDYTPYVGNPDGNKEFGEYSVTNRISAATSGSAGDERDFVRWDKAHIISLVENRPPVTLKYDIDEADYGAFTLGYKKPDAPSVAEGNDDSAMATGWYRYRIAYKYSDGGILEGEASDSTDYEHTDDTKNIKVYIGSFPSGVEYVCLYRSPKADTQASLGTEQLVAELQLSDLDVGGYYYDSTADTALGRTYYTWGDGGYPPQCSHGAVFRNRLFLGNNYRDNHPNRLYWSEAFDPHIFDSDNWVDVGETGDPIKKVMQFGEDLFCINLRSVYLIQLLSTADVRPYLLYPRGTVASKSVAAYEGGIFFLGNDDVYLMSRGFIRRVGGPLQPAIKALTRAKLEVSCAAIYKDWYILAMVEEGSSATKPDIAYCLHLPSLEQGKIRWFGPMKPLNASCFIVKEAPAVEQALYFGNHEDKRLTQFDTGSDDNGATISAILETGNIDFGNGRYKFFKDMGMELDPPAAGGDVSIDWNLDDA